MSPAVPIVSLLLLASTVLVAGCSSPTSSGQVALTSRSADVAAAGESAMHDGPVARRAADAVARASAAEVAAFMAADPDALAALWSESFVVTNPFNQLVGKQQVLTLVSSGILAFSAYDRTIDYARVYGDMVIVAGRETVIWSGRMPLAGQTSLLRYTAVWSRHGNEWQEVARHANIILPGVPGGPPTP